MPKRPTLFKQYRLREKVIESRPNAHERGYCSKQHKAWRKAILNRDNFQCQQCKKVFHDTSMLHADHIMPIELGGSRYSLSNGQCLCRSCHGIKTASEINRKQGKWEKRSTNKKDSKSYSKND